MSDKATAAVPRDADGLGGWYWEPKAECLSVAELRDLQTQRLRAAMRHAHDNVPFYKKTLDEAGVAAADIDCPGAVSDLPFTTKLDLRDNYPFDMFAVPREEVVRVHASSGTTGNPTVVGYTRDDIHLWSGLIARTLAAGGVHAGDLLQNAYGYGLFTGGMGLHYGAELLGLHGAAHLRRRHRAADKAHARLPCHGACLHAVVRPLPRGGGARQGAAARRPAGARRFLRRRAVDQRDARADRAGPGRRRHGHLRPLRDGRARRRLRVPVPGRHARQRGPLPGRDRRSRDAQAGARGHGGRARASPPSRGGRSRSSATARATCAASSTSRVPAGAPSRA